MPNILVVNSIYRNEKLDGYSVNEDFAIDGLSSFIAAKSLMRLKTTLLFTITIKISVYFYR